MGLGTWLSCLNSEFQIACEGRQLSRKDYSTPNSKPRRYYIYESMESSLFCNCCFFGKVGFKFQRSCYQLSLKLSWSSNLSVSGKLGGSDSCILSSLLKKCIMLLTFHVSENEPQKQTFECFGIRKGQPVWILRMSPFFQLYAQETCGASTTTVGLIFAVMPSACFIGEGLWCRGETDLVNWRWDFK